MVYEPYVDPTPSSPNLVCVYDIVDVSRETRIMSSYASGAYTSMIVDGVEMDFDCYYQFDTEGLHTVEFVFDEEYKTTLPSQGFDFVTQLVSITIPESITSIPLDSIRFDNLKEFKGKYASKDGKCLIIDNKLHMVVKKDLTSFIVPDGVTTIGGEAFRDCNSLTSVTIPDSVTTIGELAFSYCRSLTSITIPDSVTTIGGSAFTDCNSLPVIDNIRYADTYLVDAVDTSLTTYSINPGTRFIGSYAFSYCSNLASVNIPDSVTTIGYGAFYYCGSLESVTIGDSVTTIGGDAFIGCDSLTSMYCKATTPPDGGYHMFGSDASGRVIYVPNESVEAYKTAEYWNYYANAIEGYNF